jgi:two-component system, NtrC family, nitrogen regulation response regulator NtrX
VFPIRSPALRERVEDIPSLAHAFMAQFASENGIVPKPIDEAVVAALVSRKWPGNVRELKNVVERAAILSGDHVTIADLPEDPHESPFGEDPDGSSPDGTAAVFPDDDATAAPVAPMTADGKPLTLREYREKSERQYIVDTLRMTGWNISRTAILLGVERTNLHKKIRAYDIKRGEG